MSEAFAACRAAWLRAAEGAAVPPDRPAWIYGAGSFGRSIARELLRLGRPVRGFIDRKAGAIGPVEGLPTRAPGELNDEDVRGTAYLHGVMNQATPSLDIVTWAAGRGFDDLVFPARLHAIPGFSLTNYWWAPAPETLAHLDAIEALHDGLDDDKSRAILTRLLEYRLSTDPRLHPEIGADDLYGPDFLPIFERPITFVDGGAFTGDTLEALLARGVSIADWVAFEPDAGNAEALRRTAGARRADIASFTLVQAGLGAESGTMRFVSEAGAASRMLGADEPADAGEAVTTIAVAKLDDVVRRSGAIYVKLDIEGAEMDALRGMAELLGQRPVMAISLYHRPSDLWEIPRLVGELYARPRMRIRQHRHHGFDTVLYVWPA